MPRPGWTLTIFLCLVTLFLWGLAAPLSARFSSLPLTLLSLGRISGLVGLTLFSLNVIYSSRLKFLESLFGGMNRVYVAHHTTGGIAFILLLLHPVFILGSYLYFSLPSAVSLLLDMTSLPLVFGRTALFLLTALLVLTFYIRLPYQIWRFTHKFLGGVLFIGGLHAFLIPSDLSSYPPLKYFQIALAAMALTLWVYRTVLGRFLVPRRHFRVTSVHPENSGLAHEIILSSVDNQPVSFYPGQFIFISFDQPGFTETHPFSLTSLPGSKEISICAKDSGDYTHRLGRLQTRTIARLEGPFGRFSYLLYPRPRQVWIAGGIGITPFISMARHLSDPKYRIDLYYTAKNPREAVFLNRLKDLARTKPGLRLTAHYSDTAGRLTADRIIRQSGSPENTEYFICGPSPMMTSLRRQLNKIGVRHSRIHTEEFSID